MNHYKIKVNPYIYWTDETLRKQENELLIKAWGIFDISLSYPSFDKTFFSLDKTWVSYEYKWSSSDLSYYVNTDLDIDIVKNSISTSYPVCDITPVKYENDDLNQILIQKWEEFILNEDYFSYNKTYIFSWNDISLLSSFNIHQVDYFHKILWLVWDLNPWEFSRYQITILPSSDYFKKIIKKNDFELNNLKQSKWLWIFVKENKQISTSQRSILDSLSKEKINSQWFFLVLRFHFISREENKQSVINKSKMISQIIEKLSIYDSEFTEVKEWNDYFYNYYNSIVNWKALNKWSVLVKNEILSFFHFPTIQNIKTPNLKIQLFQKLPIPSDLICNTPNNKDIIVWLNDYNWRDNKFYMDDNLRFRHSYIIWTSWSWKSTLMENMVQQDIYNWNWVFLLDPHWDLVDNIMKKFPDPRNPKYKDRYKDLVYIDFWDKERSVWLNILESGDKYEESKVINAFTDLLQKVFPDAWESMWPTFFQYIIYTIKTIKLFERYYKPTLADIIRVLTSDEYRRMCLQQIKKENEADYMDIYDFWDNHEKRTWEWSQSQNKDEIVPHISTKLTRFTENPYISNIISQPDSTINFFDLMNSNKIILVKMSKWSIWEENMRFLWLIVISKLLLDIFKRESIKEEDRVPFYIYVDEFQNFVTKEFEQILSEARKYKVSLNIAHQYIDQLINQRTKDESVQKAVFWNAWTFISFRVWSNDTLKLEERYWNKVLLPKESFINIDKHYAYISTQWWSSTKNALQPFHIKTILSDKPNILKRDEKWKIIKPELIDYDLINEIINHSKNTYCWDLEKIKKHKEKFSSWFK